VVSFRKSDFLREDTFPVELEISFNGDAFRSVVIYVIRKEVKLGLLILANCSHK